MARFKTNIFFRAIVCSFCLTPFLLVLTSQTRAEFQASPAHRSLVAGYKVTMTCSATFNAGRSVDDIAGDELARIYPDYRDAMASLPDASIDHDKKIVSVVYDENMPPRYAVWRPYLGCSQLPTGAALSMLAAIPYVDFAEERRAHKNEWPIGDILGGAILADTPNGGVLSKAVDKAFDKLTYGNGTETTSVLVVKDGAIIAERYRDGFDMHTPQRTWSVAKSIGATVFGAAIEAGIVTVNTPVALEAWSGAGDPRGKITFADLLHMSSGLDQLTAGNRTDAVYFGGGRIVDHAITNRLVAEPGTRWRYANNDTMAIMRGLRENIADDAAFLRFPFEAVLRPLSMNHTFLETDWNGDFVFSSQVWTTPRDLARLGLLYLSDGEFDGQRITPEGWSTYVSTPAPDQPGPRSTGELRPGYGAQFWLFDERHGLPKGTYSANGNRGQYLVIIPERNILVIRRGFDDNGGARFDIAAFVADILAATE